jgi:hypothetical protein
MRRSLTLAVLVAALAGVSAKGRQTSECAPHGDVRFVCGLGDPEDLVAIPRSEWIVASTLQSGVGLHAVSTRTFAVTKVFPAAAAKVRHDRGRYGDCPGPIDTAAVAKYDAHGLAVRTGAARTHTLYVVHHSARESIEVFAVDATPATLAVTWVGCLVAPQGVVFNAVAPLPDGGVVATHFVRAGLPAEDRGTPTGEVWEWQPARGWAIVPGSEAVGPNGIEVSSDGRWLYVNLWLAQQVMRLSRGQAPPAKTLAPLPFRADNMHWDTDGTLLIAGHGDATIPRIVECFRRMVCSDPTSNVARLDPATLRADQLIRYPYNPQFWGASSAIRVGREIWMGAPAGTRIARYPLP